MGKNTNGNDEVPDKIEKTCKIVIRAMLGKRKCALGGLRGLNASFIL